MNTGGLPDSAIMQLCKSSFFAVSIWVKKNGWNVEIACNIKKVVNQHCPRLQIGAYSLPSCNSIKNNEF